MLLQTDMEWLLTLLTWRLQKPHLPSSLWAKGTPPPPLHLLPWQPCRSAVCARVSVYSSEGALPVPGRSQVLPGTTWVIFPSWIPSSSSSFFFFLFFSLSLCVKNPENSCSITFSSQTIALLTNRYWLRTDTYELMLFLMYVLVFPWAEKSQRWGALRPDHVPPGHHRERLLRTALHGLSTSACKIEDSFRFFCIILFQCWLFFIVEF